MRLPRAVLQIPPGSSVQPGLPLYNSRFRLTHAKSTLTQVLIPLHFNSSRYNTYKKPGGGPPLPAPKFGNSLLPPPHQSGRTGTPTTPIPSSTCAHFPSHLAGWDSQSWLSLSAFPTGHGPGATGHGSSGPKYRCAPTRKVPESRMLLLWVTPGKHSAPPGV